MCGIGIVGTKNKSKKRQKQKLTPGFEPGASAPLTIVLTTRPSRQVLRKDPEFAHLHRGLSANLMEYIDNSELNMC